MHALALTSLWACLHTRWLWRALLLHHTWSTLLLLLLLLPPLPELAWHQHAHDCCSLR